MSFLPFSSIFISVISFHFISFYFQKYSYFHFLSCFYYYHIIIILIFIIVFPLTLALFIHSAICEKMVHISAVFDCLADMEKSQQTIDEISGLLKDFRILWEAYLSVVKIIEDVKAVEWRDMESDDLNDISKNLLSSVRYRIDDALFYL